MSIAKLFNFETHAVTHPGKKRKINEDACISLDAICLWAVADGMGGHSAGDVASQNLVNALQAVRAPSSLSEFVNDVESQVINCNAQLQHISATELDNRIIGSTLASILIYQGVCVYLWVGDSRVYRQREGRLVQLSKDHSQVEELIEQGLVLREDAEAHPDANIITRAVGVEPSLFVDLNVDEVQVGDTYLLCSDGLSKHVEFHEIEKELAEGGAAVDMCDRLIGLTLERGATDNVTVSVINVQDK